MNLHRWQIGGMLCLLVVALASLSVLKRPSSARSTQAGVASDRVEELAAFMESLVDDGKIAGGVTLMARHGQVVHLKAVGLSDLEKKTPMQTNAIFRIASMTKPITNAAILMLFEQRKLSLDDPVSKYIPEFKDPEVLVRADPLTTRPAKREITIRHLLTHTSGLGYDFTETLGPIYEKNGIPACLCSTPMRLEQAMAKLARQPLLFDPGERWEYGLSTDVLGRVVEVVSGRSLDRFIEDEICRPLKMNDTFFQVPPEKLPRLVSAYVRVGSSLREVKEGEILKHELGPGAITISSDYPYAPSNRYRSGGAGLCSTAGDYLRFCQMLLGGGELDGVRLLQRETVRMMMTNQLGDASEQFGFGFKIMPETDEIDEQLRASCAWSGFWSTSFRISPRGDWIHVTMTQVAWDEEATPAWHAHYDTLAAEAVAE